MRKIKEKTIYRYFNGEYYYVRGIATDDKDNRKVVIYSKLYDNCLHIKDLEDFDSIIDTKENLKIKQKYKFQECKFDTVLNIFGFSLLHDYDSFVTYIDNDNNVLELSENTIEYYYLDELNGAIYKPITDEILLLSEIIKNKKFKSENI